MSGTKPKLAIIILIIIIKNEWLLKTIQLLCKLFISRIYGGARGVMVIVVGNGHGDTSSNPGRD